MNGGVSRERGEGRIPSTLSGRQDRRQTKEGRKEVKIEKYRDGEKALPCRFDMWPRV